ncbi:MAG: PA14 domain-containing protein, partial [Planctomycetota bacterium]|nr:PA14 domain-containing protein [Planctomycetota bacterium]
PAAPATGTTRAAFGPDDPRERYARNQLDALKAKEKAGSVSAGELRRSLEVFVERYGSTRAGDDAAAWLKTLPAATVYTPAAGGVDDPARWQNAVALLPLVDPGRDAVVGKWELRNGALLSDKTADARIEVPYRPPEEYDVRVVFTPTEGDCDVALHLVKAGRPFLWVMGGNKNTYFGFGPIGGKWCHENGTSAKSSRCLERGLRYTLVVQVRNDGFCAWLDGQRISQWKTDYRDMPTSVGWNLRDPNLLCLRSNNTPVVFHRADVLDVTGKGIVARSKETAAAGRWRAVFDGRTPNCLRGQGYGHWRVDDGALAKVAGTNDAAQTVEEFSDGQVRVCFEPSGGGSMFFTVRQGGGGYSAYFDGGLMAGKVQELAFTCRGDDVTATLNGQRIKLSSGGQSRKGCLQFNAQGGVRVLSIEHRDLPPEGAAATPATPAGAEVVWLDDALPAGAKATGSPEGYAWAWASTPEPVFSGTHSHTQAGKGGNAGGEQHYFVDANPPLGVGRRDVIFAYVYLDPKNPPKEIMMQWSSRKSWEHRAYWGDDKLPWGTNLSPSRVPMGPLPKAGEWVRLEVGASEAGFESDNEEIEGWAFAQYGGSVYWDKAGVVRNAKSAAPVAGVGPAAPTGDAPGPASAETKVAYEKLLTEVYTLLSKSDVKAARARLEQAKATPTLAAVRAALDKDLECASYVEEANKAALTGVALLADKRKFTFRTDDDKEIPTGQGTGSTVTGAKDDVVSIDQDIGGAKAILKRKLADFSPQTRYELACLGMPPGPDGELKLAFAELLALLDGAEGITAKDILNRIDAAEKGQLPREKIEGLRSRVEGRERELDARGAVKKGDALLKAGRRAEAKAYVQELKKRFTGTATLVQWLDARREELAKVLPQPGLIAEYYELKTRIYAEALSDATANAIGKRVVANIDLPAKENLGELFGRQEDVGVRFAGYIAVTEEGTYTFYSKSDDGSMLYIRDTLLVSNDGYRSMTEKSGTITLPPGSHPFRLQFCQGGSGGGVIVSWSGPGFEKQVIPPERFSYDPLETEAAAKPATPRTPPRRSP